MEFLLILFFFGLSAGTIGKIKGSSFVLWFLIGFCLPFFGTMAALLSRHERDVTLRRCPECTNLQPLHNQVCTRCGADLSFPDEYPGDDDEGDEDEPDPRQERLFEV